MAQSVRSTLEPGSRSAREPSLKSNPALNEAEILAQRLAPRVSALTGLLSETPDLIDYFNGEDNAGVVYDIDDDQTKLRLAIGLCSGGSEPGDGIKIIGKFKAPDQEEGPGFDLYRITNEGEVFNIANPDSSPASGTWKRLGANASKKLEEAEFMFGLVLDHGRRRLSEEIVHSGRKVDEIKDHRRLVRARDMADDPEKFKLLGEVLEAYVDLELLPTDQPGDATRPKKDLKTLEEALRDRSIDLDDIDQLRGFVTKVGSTNKKYDQLTKDIEGWQEHREAIASAVRQLDATYRPTF